MISLTDRQMKLVTERAALLPVEKRELFLQRVAAQIEMRWGRRRTDDDAVSAAVSSAITGLLHEVA